jgi:hypothetical protein
MSPSKEKNNKKDTALPDWLSSGQDLFGTIQIIRGKSIQKGFLEIDFDFKFSETFNYPIIFEIKSSNADIVADAIAFRIDGEIDPARKAIEESIIAPKICSTLRKNDFINFFADVVEKDVNFALYINKMPEKFKDIKIYNLSETQKIVFNDRFIFAITEALDKRKK